MKKQLLLVSVIFISMLSFGQGIVFEHGTWKDVLEKAKQTNKPIFVDIYTTWCGPCKKMSKDIFPLAEVGKVYNADFVCYQIDAEKGEGIDVAKKYEVNSYPTYLFIKADGVLFSRAVGSMPTENFIAVAKTALADLTDPKPIGVLEKEYAEKKNDPAFLLEYMNKLSKLGKSNAQLFDEYLALLPADQRASKEILDIYQKEGQYLKMNSLAYKNLQDNAVLFFPKVGGYIYVYMSRAIDNSFREAASTKNEVLLQQVVEANEKLPQTAARKTKEELYMNYYKRTGDMEKYVSNATAYCESALMSVLPDSIARIDKKKLQDFDPTPLIGKIDSAQLAQLKEYMAHAERNQYSMALNEVAWGFFEKVTDEKALASAISWSKRSVEIYPENHMYMDTYANLLYKAGRKDEALAKENEALTLAQNAKADTKGYEETIANIKAGKKTWK